MSAKNNELRSMLRKVDRLAKAMKRKLRLKANHGFSGGLDPAYRTNVENKLFIHVLREARGENQAVDICNLAMMLWREE